MTAKELAFRLSLYGGTRRDALGREETAAGSFPRHASWHRDTDPDPDRARRVAASPDGPADLPPRAPGGSRRGPCLLFVPGREPG
ncbi:hypothetical protein Skr01_11700 [Sphaerisporangium krabiense]|nr:hypothetical protein Skr01_11700 [Sphaerisporangium krabiense]